MPVFRPIALQTIEGAHDLFRKPPTLWGIMRVRAPLQKCHEDPK
jgi:hypothetical protein